MDPDSFQKSQAQGQPQTDPDHLFHPVPLPGSQVLTDEGHPRLVEGVHGHIEEILQTGSGAVGGHHHTAELVDGPLDHHI